MGRQLIQELFDAVFLSWAVNIGNLILWQTGEVQLDLQSRQGELKLQMNTDLSVLLEVHQSVHQSEPHFSRLVANVLPVFNHTRLYYCCKNVSQHLFKAKLYLPSLLYQLGKCEAVHMP